MNLPHQGVAEFERVVPDVCLARLQIAPMATILSSSCQPAHHTEFEEKFR
jgi:hypothetical protein